MGISQKKIELQLEPEIPLLVLYLNTKSPYSIKGTNAYTITYKRHIHTIIHIKISAHYNSYKDICTSSLYKGETLSTIAECSATSEWRVKMWNTVES